METEKVEVFQKRDGKFKPGNKLGKGNPFAGRVAKLRAIALDAVTEEDMKEVIATLIRKAKEGDIAAAKLLLDRIIGRAPLDIQVAFLDSEGNPQLGTVARVDAANHRYIDDGSKS